MRASTVFAIFAAGVQAATYTFANTTVDISLISSSDKSAYCRGQLNTCLDLCDSNTNANTCTTATLDYTCTCGNGDAPSDLDEYSTSMEAYMCQVAYSQCITNSGTSALAQKGCKSSILDTCGTKNVNDATSSSSTTSAAASTASATAAATSDSEAAATTSAAAAATTTHTSGASAHVFGSGAIVAALMAALL